MNDLSSPTIYLLAIKPAWGNISSFIAIPWTLFRVNVTEPIRDLVQEDNKITLQGSHFEVYLKQWLFE